MSVILSMMLLVSPAQAQIYLDGPPPPVYNVLTDAPHTSEGLRSWLSAVGYPWDPIGTCESYRDGSWRASSASPARGVFQFLLSTWHSLGQTGDPAKKSWRYQLKEAKILGKRDGIRHSWVCARELGIS